MSEEDADRRKISDGIEIIVDEAGAAVKSALRKSGATNLGENLKQTIQSALSSRKEVVMVRLNSESLERVDELVDGEVLSSRSEACAFLIGEGINANEELFSRISEKIEKIRAAKRELRDLLNESPVQGPTDAEDTEDSQQEGSQKSDRQE